MTKPIELAASTEIQAVVGANKITCATCLYGQLPSNSFPKITAVAKTSATQLTFTGTDFYDSGYDIIAEYMGVKASSIVTKTATEVVAEWNMGIPVSPDAQTPKLMFNSSTDGYYAVTTS